VQPLHEWVGSAAAQQFQVDESRLHSMALRESAAAGSTEVAISLSYFTENRWKTRMAP
jgi:hypothetical protein